jgi:hypothetical protein
MKQAKALLLATALFAAPACAQTAGLDAMAGHWAITGATGERLGASTIQVQTPGAMLFEERRVGNDPPQQLWFENSERTGGWVQLFLGPHGIREFTQLSRPNEWPVVLGAHVVLQNRTEADFRMTMSRRSADQYRRVLEISTDGRRTWSAVFDYVYRRDGTNQ